MPSAARIAVVVLPALWLVMLVSPALAQTPPEATNYIVLVDAAGSAVWTVEHRFLLQTDDDVRYFEEYMKTFDSQRQVFLEQFKNETIDLVDRASILTGRRMTANNFTVVIDSLKTATGKFGLVVYSFRWVGFARREGPAIIIGDVFEGGLYLYKDDTFSLRAPSQLSVVYASPPPDVSRQGELIWYGLRHFGSGEPRAEFTLEATTASSQTFVSPSVSESSDSTAVSSRTTASRLETSFLSSTASSFAGTFDFGSSSWALWFVLAIAVILLTFTIVLRFRKRSVSLESDEEKVISVLREAGGVLFQSEIKRRTGFSKAKTSVVLKALEEKGSVGKTRRGREFIVRLKD